MKEVFSKVRPKHRRGRPGEHLGDPLVPCIQVLHNFLADIGGNERAVMVKENRSHRYKGVAVVEIVEETLWPCRPVIRCSCHYQGQQGLVHGGRQSS